MAKDGTNRDGRRVRAGAKLDPLNEKLAAGRPATRLEDPLNEPFDFEGGDIGAGAVLAGETMPEPSDYLFEVQRDGKPLGADLVYRETWRRLDARGCPQFVAPRLIESYAQAFARYVQCEQAISKFGLLGKPPPPVPPSRPRSSPCRSRLVSRRMCTGTRFTRSSAPPARPTIRVRRLRIS